MKILSTVLASFSEALAEGAIMLPNLMFVGLYAQHDGELGYVLPFVLLYAFQKAGAFLLGGFGRLKNPGSCGFGAIAWQPPGAWRCFSGRGAAVCGMSAR